MKSKIWPDDTTVPEMDEWLAELRDNGPAVPSDSGRAESSAAPSDEGRAESSAAPSDAGRAEPPAASVAPPWPPAEPVAPPWPLAEPAALPVHAALPMLGAPPRLPAEVAVHAEPAIPDAPATVTMRAVIGDQLRIPISWCEMGSCISWHADPEALGEGDERARAIEVGWRLDAFGRLACPRCQQADPGFRATHPVVPWDRYTAMARAARFAASSGARASGF